MVRPTHSRLARFDGVALAFLLMLSAFVGGRLWLAAHPEQNPWAPLALTDPSGWATQRKLADLRSDPGQCRAVLSRSTVAFEELAPVGEGQCRREDRVTLDQAPLAPRSPSMTCAVAAAFERWLQTSVQPAAQEIFGAPVIRIDHLGTFSCRRLYGRATGRWSEHAQANAIDIAAFVLEDGQRISVQADWHGDGAAAQFLHRARDGACQSFATVLSPDYNDAHADHFHLDQARRGFGGVCR